MTSPQWGRTFGWVDRAHPSAKPSRQRAEDQSDCSEAYAPEFRRQMVDLVRAGRSPEELAKEFEPTAKSIRNWVAQADRDEGRRADGLTSAEREELVRLRRENHQLKLEREILSKAAAWFARETDAIPPKGSSS